MIGFYAEFARKATHIHKMETIIAAIVAPTLHLLAWGAYKVKKYSRRAIVPLKTTIMIFIHCLMAPTESEEADEQGQVEFQEVSPEYSISG